MWRCVFQDVCMEIYGLCLYMWALYGYVCVSVCVLGGSGDALLAELDL